MGPLENVRVVELATYLAAPTCARVMADWGADVIKVEPLQGDVYRSNGPAQGCPTTEVANPTFDNHNAGKKYVSLNLRSEAGMEVLHELLKNADVFITNNRNDALAAMHLTYEELKDKYPTLIYAQILGYGDKGPDCNKPGFDYTAFFSRAGILADLAPAGGPPCSVVPGLGDHSASLSLVSGICAALFSRVKTGKGQKVDCSLLQVGCFLLQTPFRVAIMVVSCPEPTSTPLSQTVTLIDALMTSGSSWSLRTIPVSSPSSVMTCLITLSCWMMSASIPEKSI